MSPTPALTNDDLDSFPRVSGDEPNTGERSVQWRSFSPRERG